MINVAEIVKRCLSYGVEAEWFDFKDNVFKPDEIGEYISALSNAAAMEREPFGYLIWGINNDTKEIRYIRIGSSKEKFKRYPDRETELFKILIEKENPTDDWESEISKFRISDIDMTVFKEYLQKAKTAGRITFKSSIPKAVLNKLELTDDEYLLNAGAALFVDSGINELQMAKFATDERITFNDIKMLKNRKAIHHEGAAKGGYWVVNE